MPACQNRIAPLRALFGMALLAVTSLCSSAESPDPLEQQEYWARFEKRDWSAAVDEAQGLVNKARNDPADQWQLAEALNLLGNAQLGARNLPAAEAAFGSALAIVEPRVSPGSDKLLDPLRGLGYARAANGKHGEAIPLLQRALLIARRNFGLFDLGQQGVLRQLATSLTAVNDPVEAEKHMLYTLQIGQRSYGAHDLRMAPLHCAMGDWYTQIGVMAPARQHYRQALDIAERQGGENHIALVVPLRSLATSYRRELFLTNAGLLRQPEPEPAPTDVMAHDTRPISAQSLNSEGERALLRAVKVIETHAATEKIEQLRIDTLVDTGDWYQTRSQPQKAFEFYRRAAALMPPAAQDSAAAAAGPFGFPVQVYLPTPLLATRNRFRPDHEIVERFVQVEFTVASDGSVKDGHIVEQDATSRQAAETLNAIHAARYRPRFVNGEPVATMGVSHRQIFRQRKDRDTEASDKAS
jgi:tetratricopeptide (TPR) repeat protein